MEWYEKIALSVAGVGALNWGLFQFAQINLVSYVQEWSAWVYGGIAIAGIYTGYFALFKKRG